MFRKTKTEPAPAPVASKPGGKGRPTPSRKEAEAARKERLKASLDSKASRRSERAHNAELRKRAMAGMKAGDEKYLMPRDRGPVRRYIRDWIDARFTVIEFVLPVLLVVLLINITQNKTLIQIGGVIWGVSIILLFLDLGWLYFRLSRDLKRKFPGESLRGSTFYAFMRAMQVRPLRMPKPQVKRGQKPA